MYKRNSNEISMLSIIIPVHNAEKFIEQTIISLLKKQSTEYEIIFVLDNCTDNTKSVIENFFRSYPEQKHKIFEVSFGSTALSRNFGLENSKSHYIAFLDHDDIVDISLYNRLILFAHDQPACDVIRCGFTITRENSTEVCENIPDPKQYPFYGIFIWNGMFKREFLVKNSIFFKKGYGEDYEFNLALLANGAREGRLGGDNSYYQWQHHGNNLHKKRTPKDFYDRIDSMVGSYLSYLQSDHQTKRYMCDWVLSYILHLVKTGNIQSVAQGYFESSGTRKILLEFTTTIKNNLHRDLVQAKDEKEFIKIAQQINACKKEDVSCQNSIAGIFSLSAAVKKAKIYLKGCKKNYKIYKKYQSSEKQLVQNQIRFINNTPKKKALFFVFHREWISGGLISIYSIAEEFRANGIEPVLTTKPVLCHTAVNNLFANREVTIPFREILKQDTMSYSHVMIPEVKVKEFNKLCEEYNLRFPNAIMNIINQNNDYMPEQEHIKKLAAIGKSITVTTAHEKYSTQENCDKWHAPVKHLSTYLSHRDYIFQSFEEKRNLILYSVDHHPLKERVQHYVHNQLPNYEKQVVGGISYDDYKKLVTRTKFGVTFGEALDNYFIEPFFTGGIGFAVYNPNFMKSFMLNMDNIFSSYADMARELPALMLRLLQNKDYRHEIWHKNFEILSDLYDGAKYKQKVSSYLSGHYDFYPEKMLPHLNADSYKQDNRTNKADFTEEFILRGKSIA